METTRDPSAGDGPARHDRLLIISDDPAEIGQMREVLKPSGLRIVEADLGSVAANDAVGEGVAVVVLDVRHEWIGAVEAARAIRSRPEAVATPIILLADRAAAGSAAASAYALGAVDIVDSQIAPDALRAKVTVLAELSARGRALSVKSDRRRTDDAAQRVVVASQEAAMRALVNAEPDDVTMPLLAQSLALGLGWQAALYWASSEGAVRCLDTWFDPSLPELDREVLERAFTVGAADGIVPRAWESGEIQWATLADVEGARTAAAREAGLSAALALPITVGSETCAVIELLRNDPQPPDESTMNWVGIVEAFVGQLLEARRTQTEVDRLKNEFFALVSHELLTPLTSILGYLEDLLDGGAGEFTDDQHQDLLTLDRNAHRLFRLISDLMFVAQVESGGLTLVFTDVDLPTITHEAIEAARPAAERRGVEMAVHATPLPAVRGDPDRLGQVIYNLLSNAVKYSHEGGTVDVVLGRSGESAVVEVTDRGFGIPPEEQSHLFEKFFRSSVGVAREIPGVGLGLSISKAIVDAHGGSIALKESDGEETTFRVTLPFDGPEQGGHHEDPGAME